MADGWDRCKRVVVLGLGGGRLCCLSQLDSCKLLISVFRCWCNALQPSPCMPYTPPQGPIAAQLTSELRVPAYAAWRLPNFPLSTSPCPREIVSGSSKSGILRCGELGVDQSV